MLFLSYIYVSYVSAFCGAGNHLNLALDDSSHDSFLNESDNLYIYIIFYIILYLKYYINFDIYFILFI